MSSCSGSVRSFYDDNEVTLLAEKLDSFEAESASETREAWSYDKQKPTSIYVSSSRHAIKCMRQLGWLLHAILPSFLQTCLQKESGHSHLTSLHATAYLDGMRGLAAFAVFLCHLSYVTFDIGHVWGAGETLQEMEGNRNLLQLPIVRLFYSGPPMVAIFFVISGYALSCKPLKQMRKGELEGLMNTLTSSVFRRALRLFLPCLASTFIIVCLARLGAYQLTEDFAQDVRAVHEVHYGTTPDLSSQVVDWSQKMLNFVNVFDWSLYAGANDIDPHLWTIPVEFRCSMALFGTHLLVARMSSLTRISTLTFLLAWGTYWNRWEMIPFWAGAVVAELDLIKSSKEEQLKELTANDYDDCTSYRSPWKKCMFMGVFVVGLFLASYPDADGHVSPGYIMLTKMIPKRYSEKHRFWANIGAILIVWSAGNLYYIKQVFNTKLMQYLGTISFPLYVCHGFVIHTFTYMSLDWIWEVTDAYNDWARFVKGFTIVALCTITITVWISDLFLRFVDARCVNFARWLEKQVFVH